MLIDAALCYSHQTWATGVVDNFWATEKMRISRALVPKADFRPRIRDAGGACLASPAVAQRLLIPRTASIEHLRENLQASRLQIPSEVITDLDAIGTRSTGSTSRSTAVASGQTRCAMPK